MTRWVMWVLLAAVAAAAAVLSFSALQDLAVLCGFHPKLAWLLPLVVDAGAGVGCLVWLGGGRHLGAARRFARALTWTLLASSVAGNAIVHGLAAYGMAAPWWLVVAVSAIAPAVLGAVVHLAVLVVRTEPAPEQAEVDQPEDDDEDQGDDVEPAGLTLVPADRLGELLSQGASRRVIASTLGITEYRAKQLLASRNGGRS